MTDATEAQRGFRAMLLRAAGVGLVAAGALCAWRLEVGGGFLLGLAAGVGAYLWLARTLPKMGEVAHEDLAVYSVRQAVGRLGLYAVAFAMAYKLDPVHNMGLLGALGGYLFLRAVLVVNAWRASRQP